MVLHRCTMSPNEARQTVITFIACNKQPTHRLVSLSHFSFTFIPSYS